MSSLILIPGITKPNLLEVYFLIISMTLVSKHLQHMKMFLKLKIICVIISTFTWGIKMKEFKQGDMDITVQTETFQGFIKGIIYVTGFCVAVLVFLAIFAY